MKLTAEETNYVANDLNAVNEALMNELKTLNEKIAGLQERLTYFEGVIDGLKFSIPANTQAILVKRCEK